MINKRIVWIFCLGLTAHQVALADMETAKQALDAGDYVSAEKEFRSHAEAGEANAQYILGRMYEKGNGLVKDEAWAITWYRKAADQGHALARDTLNRIYAEAGIPSPYLETAEIPQQQPLAAQAEAAVIHNPVPATPGTEDRSTQIENLRLMAAAMDAQSAGDSETAAANYQSLAEAGDAVAQTRLAGMYMQGDGVEQDPGKAAHWYLQSAKQGNAGAQYQIAKMYQNGEGVEQNPDEAFSWYRSAASQGHAAADVEFDAMIDAAEAERLAAAEQSRQEQQAALAEQAAAVEEEKPAKKGFFASLFGGDEPQQAKQEESAQAEAGDAVAELEQQAEPLLEAEQEKPLNQPIPLEEANELPQPLPIAETQGDEQPVISEPDQAPAPIDTAAAEQADQLQAEAARYQTGEGVEKDLAKAADLYQQAAEQGSADAQFNLANMYLLGEGLEQDDAWAITWYRKAAAQGHAEAQQNLDNLYQAVGIEPEARIENIVAASTPEPEPVAVPAEPVEAEPVIAEAQEQEQAPAEAVSIAVAGTEAEAEDGVEQKGFFARLFGGEEEQIEQAETPVVPAEPVEVAKVEPAEPEPVVAEQLEAQAEVAEPVSITTAESEDQSAPEQKGFLARLFGGADEQQQTAEDQVVAEVSDKEPEPVEVAKAESVEEQTLVVEQAEAHAEVAEPVSIAATESEDQSAPEQKGFLARLFGGADEQQQTAEGQVAAEVSDKESEPPEVAKVEPVEAETVAVEQVEAQAEVAEPISIAATDAEPETGPEQKGFFSRLFGGNDEQQDSVEPQLARTEPVAEPVVSAVATTAETAVTGTEAAAETGETAAVASAGLGGFFSGLFVGNQEPGSSETAETITPVEAEKAIEDSTALTANVEQDDRTAAAIERIESDINAGVASTRLPEIKPEPRISVAQAKDALDSGDYGTALEIFRELSEQGDAEAQAHLGYMYFIGEGVAKDSQEAIYWLNESAKQGDADAQYNLAVAHAFGDGVEQSHTQAVYWYRKSAEQGHLKAQYSLAISYTRGEGVATDLVEAVRWYRSAARGGDADAQYYLGYLLQVGAGVELNRDEALKWFRRAADQGHAAAEEQAANMMSDSSTF